MKDSRMLLAFLVELFFTATYFGVIFVLMTIFKVSFDLHPSVATYLATIVMLCFRSTLRKSAKLTSIRIMLITKSLFVNLVECFLLIVGGFGLGVIMANYLLEITNWHTKEILTDFSLFGFMAGGAMFWLFEDAIRKLILERRKSKAVENGQLPKEQTKT